MGGRQEPLSPPAGDQQAVPIKVMALDWGKRRIGIAVCDELGIAAHGLPTLFRKNVRHDLDALTALIRERGIATLVVGRPLHWDGSESPSSVQAERFGRRLAGRAGVELEMWDERLTSWEAEERLGRAARKKGATDRMAAIVLLESFLASRFG